jgi:hypothetical protein
MKALAGYEFSYILHGTEGNKFERTKDFQQETVAT